MKTTFNKLKLAGACKEGYDKLSAFLGGADNYGKNKDINLLTILESNGFDDTIWCFRAVDGFDKEKRLFAVFCARQVQHLMTDKRSINAIDIAEKFANGEATVEELEAAYAAADTAAYAAADTAAYAAAAAAAYAAYTAAYAAAAAAAYAAYTAAYAAADTAAYAAAAAAAAAYDDDAIKEVSKIQESELRRILKGCI